MSPLSPSFLVAGRRPGNMHGLEKEMPLTTGWSPSREYRRKLCRSPCFMKGKMTTGSGKPSRSEPWKQTPEHPQREIHHSGYAEKGNPTPLPDKLGLPLSHPLKSNLYIVWEVGNKDSSFREALSQGCFRSPPGDLSYFWEEVRGHIPS